ncbi:GtrA family protein [Microbacterium sp. 22303]|uniref:GtrA family protein n=1 Tax=Microbacterium sp. 22303 TaxID=3453905 RepID=UPI003F84079A
MRGLLRQIAAFGVVGVVGLVVDVGLFNFLRSSVLGPDSFTGAVFIAKVISSMVAIAVNWAGNRYWSFAAERTAAPGREMLGFFAVSVSAMAVPLGCLFVSHVILGLTSALADNVASNVIGLVLGAVVRFVLYRRWVFTGLRKRHLPVVQRRPIVVES